MSLDYLYSDNESFDDEEVEDELVEPGLNPLEQNFTNQMDEEFPHKVFTTEDIMTHMVKTINEVNSVVQVRPSSLV